MTDHFGSPIDPDDEQQLDEALARLRRIEPPLEARAAHRLAISTALEASTVVPPRLPHWWQRSIIDITSNLHRGRLLLVRSGQQPLTELALILQQLLVMQFAAQMPIRGVNKSHHSPIPFSFVRDARLTPLRLATFAHLIMRQPDCGKRPRLPPCSGGTPSSKPALAGVGRTHHR